MAWFKVDDGLPDHRKVRALGRERVAAMGVWTLCGAWAARNLTDGFVPDEIAKRHDPRGKYAAKLCAVGLWARDESEGESGFRFHDWSDVQPTKAAVEARRAETRGRVAKHRASRNSDQQGERGGPDGPPTPPRGNAVGNALQGEGGNESVLTGARAYTGVPARPGPTRPVPMAEIQGGGVPDSTPGQPPAPRLDPTNPRCGRHAHIPAHDPGPNCRFCMDVRLSIEQAAPVDPRAAERAAFRAAVDACGMCDTNGMRELDDGSPARCDHRAPLRAVGS